MTKHNSFHSLIVFFSLMIPACLAGQLPNPLLPWVLAWDDNFDNSNWCRNDWHAYNCNDLPFSAFRTDVEPAQMPDNIEFHDDGIQTYLTQFVLEEQRQRIANSQTPPVGSTLWTYQLSAPEWMQSKALFKYGYFEVRCRLPNLIFGQTNRGLGANFWLYNETPLPDGYPRSEIDIVEFVCHPNDPQLSTCNVHQTPDQFTFYHDSQSGNPQSPLDFHSFHTFGVWWGPDFIKFYRDGINFYNARPEIAENADDMIPMRIILDINVYTYGEQLDATTLLPYNYDIDYVKVYQLDMQTCNQDYNQNSPIPALSSVYRSIKFGGGSNYPSGNSKTLTSKTSIEIKPGFEAALGSELILQIYPHCYPSEMTPCADCDCN
jgi:hypothetical protein